MVGNPRKSPKAALGLTNVETLIDGTGQITIGRLLPIDCVAIANDENISLAMLVRRPGESLSDLPSDQILVGERAARHLHFVKKLASIVAEGEISRNSERAAISKGLQLRVFTSDTSAIAWLLEEVQL